MNNRKSFVTHRHIQRHSIRTAYSFAANRIHIGRGCFELENFINFFLFELSFGSFSKNQFVCLCAKKHSKTKKIVSNSRSIKIELYSFEFVSLLVIC